MEQQGQPLSGTAQTSAYETQLFERLLKQALDQTLPTSPPAVREHKDDLERRVRASRDVILASVQRQREAYLQTNETATRLEVERTSRLERNYLARLLGFSFRPLNFAILTGYAVLLALAIVGFRPWAYVGLIGLIPILVFRSPLVRRTKSDDPLQAAIVKALAQDDDVISARALAQAARDQFEGVLYQTGVLSAVSVTGNAILEELQVRSMSTDLPDMPITGLEYMQAMGYFADTDATLRLSRLLDRTTGASIGLGGSRGSGKTALIRRYTEDPTTTIHHRQPVLRAMVSAPVNYNAHDFLLELFATLCIRAGARDELAGPIEPQRVADTEWLAMGLRVLAALAVGMASGLLAADLIPPVYGIVPTRVGWGVGAILGALLFMFLAIVSPIAFRVVATPQWVSAEEENMVRRQRSVLSYRTRRLELATYVALSAAGVWAILWGSLFARLGWRTSAAALLIIVGAWAVYVTWFARSISIPTIRFETSGIGSPNQSIVAIANRWLRTIRYQMTLASTWSATLSATTGSVGFGAQGSKGATTTLAAAPMSLPAVADGIRDFIAQLIAINGESTRDSNSGPQQVVPVVIGIDELDKVSDPAKVQELLNNIKAIFGIDNCYYLVSVSDDAVVGFERRGMPLRDALDTAFDEVIRLRPLKYVESRAIIDRRLIDLPLPFQALIHVLGGGTPRDLIRAARNLFDVAEQLRQKPISVLVPQILMADFQRQVDAAGLAIRSETADETSGVEPAMRWTRDLGHLPLEAIPVGGQAALVHNMSGVAAAPRRRCEELAVLAYLYATVIALFNASFTRDRYTLISNMVQGECPLDRLVDARVLIGADTGAAWAAVSDFRQVIGETQLPIPFAPFVASKIEPNPIRPAGEMGGTSSS